MTVEGRPSLQYELPPPLGNGNTEVNHETDQVSELPTDNVDAPVDREPEVVVVYIAEKPLETYTIRKGAMIQPIHSGNGGRGMAQMPFKAVRTGGFKGQQPIYRVLPNPLIMLRLDTRLWPLKIGMDFTVSNRYVKLVPDNRTNPK
jgi:hypothetical protein